MKKRTTRVSGKQKKVSFEFFAPGARKVSVAGTFNGWDPAETPLRKDGKGKWRVSFLLPPGRYEYRFWVDGTWQNDQRPVHCVPNAFGTWNCILIVH